MAENKRLKNVVSWLISQEIVDSQENLAKELGYNPSSLSQIVTGVKPVSGKFVSKLTKFCDKINPNYLWGEGDMLKSSQITQSVGSRNSGSVNQIGQMRGGDVYGIGNIERISGGRNTYNIGRGHSGEMVPDDGDGDIYSTNQRGVGVPYYDVDFMMGFDLTENDQTVNPEYHIDFPQYNRADCWVNATGKSMSPLIDHGDKIAVKHIVDWAENILYGEVYAIVTDSLRTIKKVRRSLKGDDYLRLVPENTEEFDEQDVHKQTIRGVYHVLGCAKLLS